jgi:predicted ATPase
LAQACLVEARQGNSELNLCFVLGLAVCPVALMRGDIPGAQRFVAMLMEVATRQSFTQYVNVGRFLEAALMVERGEFALASTQLRAVLDTREGTGWRLSHPEVAGILANALAGQARSDEALTTVDWGMTIAEEGGIRWYIPELLRIKGEVLRRYKTREKFSASEECFREAIDVAKEQGALLWELRATLSLAGAMMEQGKVADLHRVLSSVYGKFTEGFEATDLRNARMMLEACRPMARGSGLRRVD